MCPHPGWTDNESLLLLSIPTVVYIQADDAPLAKLQTILRPILVHRLAKQGAHHRSGSFPAITIRSGGQGPLQAGGTEVWHGPTAAQRAPHALAELEQTVGRLGPLRWVLAAQVSQNQFQPARIGVIIALTGRPVVVVTVRVGVRFPTTVYAGVMQVNCGLLAVPHSWHHQSIVRRVRQRLGRALVAW